jgi:Ran GTPase-activating protein (RanGAP) involved in mRNA processing and transport
MAADPFKFSYGASGAKEIADAVKRHKDRFPSLKIPSRHISDNGAAEISDTLLNDNEIELYSISLADNNICNFGVFAIARSLWYNTNLVTLNLNHNPIGCSGAQAIAEALQFNRRLECLSLEGNGIANLGAEAIAAMLNSNISLKFLDLKSNSIGDQGLEKICNSLIKNSCLTGLVISYNPYDASDLKCLQEALRKNGTLLHLEVSAQDEALISLAGLLKRNESILHHLGIMNRKKPAFPSKLFEKVLPKNTSIFSLKLNGGICSKVEHSLANNLCKFQRDLKVILVLKLQQQTTCVDLNLVKYIFSYFSFRSPLGIAISMLDGI